MRRCIDDSSAAASTEKVRGRKLPEKPASTPD